MSLTPSVSYLTFVETLCAALLRRTEARLVLSGRIAYAGKTEMQTYDIYRIESSPLTDTRPILLLRATIHGDEPAGSLTIMVHLAEIVEYAHAHGVALVIFPMDNPSGYERGTRYNMEDDRGDGGNNDWIRYRLSDGRIADDLGTGDAFASWLWALDPSLRVRLPKETLLAQETVKQLPLSRIAGVIDIHQDPYILFPGAYHYGFGDVALYRPVVERIQKIIRVFAHEHIDSGYLNGPSYRAETIGTGGEVIADPFDPVTDDLGFIVRHDCSLPDAFWRLGARHCITVETTTAAPSDVCDAVNLVWIKGIIDLIAQEKSEG